MNTQQTDEAFRLMAAMALVATPDQWASMKDKLVENHLSEEDIARSKPPVLTKSDKVEAAMDQARRQLRRELPARVKAAPKRKQ